MSSINLGLDPRQMMQPTQLRANEKTAAEELKAEEQQQNTETISSQKINIMKSAADIRMLHIQQAADAGILRPVWLEMMEMDPDMPRTIDLIRRSGEKKDGDAKPVADESKRHDKTERALDGTERVTIETERSDKTERAILAEQTTDGTDINVKSEQTTDGAEYTFKSESAEGDSRSAENLSE